MLQIIDYETIADLVGDVGIGADGYRPADLADLAPTPGMSSVDQLARAWASDVFISEYESDGMGATARIVELSEADAAILAMCAMADSEAASAYYNPHYAAGSRCPLDYADHGDRWAYIRSDDHGFWDMRTGDEGTVRGWLGEWVAAYVPTYCGACAYPMSAEETATYGDGCERCAVTFFHAEPMQ